MTSRITLDVQSFTCLPDCLQRLEAVAVALFADDGHLVQANAGFRQLLGDIGLPGNIAANFIQPSLRTLLAQSVADGQPLYSGMLNLGVPNGACHTLIGTLQRQGQLLLLVAEHDVRQLQELNRQVVLLNTQLAETQRDLARSNRRLKASEARFKALSISDPLTGLANRRRLEEQLHTELERSQRYAIPFALIMADIDHFKRVNDSHGHDVGDRVLRDFAGLLRQHVRDCDLVARLGGEEFVLLLPSTEIAAALASAERLRLATRQMILKNAVEGCF